MTDTNQNLERIAQGIRDRREPDTDTDKSSATDALRDLMRADSDASIARTAQRNAQTTTDEKDI